MKGYTAALFVAMLLLAATAPGGEAAISCSTVVSSLNPCIPYVTGGGPLGSCCGGVRGLYAAARTTPDRQNVCGCLKTLAGAYSRYIGRAAALPGLCGLRIPYKISPSTDCSKVT